MSSTFAKLFFMPTSDDHQVLLTKEHLPEEPHWGILFRTVFVTVPQTKIKSFDTEEDRDRAFAKITQEEAIQFFKNARKTMDDYYPQINFNA